MEYLESTETVGAPYQNANIISSRFKGNREVHKGQIRCFE